MSFNASVNSFAVNGDQVNAPAQTDAGGVWASASAVTLLARIEEIWARLGLDATQPLITGETQITFGPVVMGMVQAGTTVTVTRQ